MTKPARTRDREGSPPQVSNTKSATDVTSTSPAAIAAFARAGAIDLAWQMLVAARPTGEEADAAWLALEGRLLKDRAASAAGDVRRDLFRQAGAAYQRAAKRDSATYPLINAASLFLLAGDAPSSKQGAQSVLDRIEANPDEPETPYYRAATRAEALLLLDREEEARAAFAEAVALAPEAWEDHASTLRQFALILAGQGRDSGWLDALRPPRSLHFGGHMAFRATRPRPALRRRIEEALAEEKVHFAYGALAAGADIIIAEAVLDRGAELHLILPGGAEAFAARSVDPWGSGWRRRFDSVLARAETVRPVRPIGAEPDLAAIALADEVAMGTALMNARRLESEAVQLLVVDDEGEAAAGGRRRGATARAGSRWAEGGWRQRLVVAPREDSPGPGEAAATAVAWRPLAMLAVGQETEDPRRLAALRTRLTEGPAAALAPYWAAGQVLIGYSRPGEAAEAALRLAAQGYSVGGSYSVAAPFADPFSGGDRLPLAATASASVACASAPAGSACVTEDFAAALVTSGPRAPAVEPVGELDPPDSGPPVALFALRSGPASS
jgi:tetratricopeptide (TPR) repeat protein